MRHASYRLSTASASPDSSNGVVNKGFQADDSNTKDDRIKSTISATKESKDDFEIQDKINNDNIYCGVGSCRPRAMQGCTNMVCFTAMYSMIGLVTSALTSYINSQITTLEKHFNFSSAMSGFIMSCNDIGYLATTLLMSYYTRRVHIPRVLSFFTMLYGISGLLCTVAFFGTTEYLVSPPKDSDGKNTSQNANFAQMCQNLSTPANASCQGDSKGPRELFEMPEHLRTIAISVIAVGMILQGVAKSPRHSFLGTYVDDNVPKTKTTMYLGIMTGLSIFGPVVAFSLGGVFSNMYITLEETNLSPRDPRWLGAWWLGFLVFGGAGLVVSIPLCFFPKQMRKQDPQIKQQKKTDKKGVRKLWHDFKGILKSVFRLAVNPVFVCMVTANGLNMLAVSGLMAFLPKYLETQFSVTASKANLLLGTMNILTAPIGTIVGGFVTSRFKLSPKACLKLMIVTKALSASVSCLGFVLGCAQPVLNMGLETSSSDTGANPQCVQGCHCDSTNYFPVCGDDGNSYFSPCHAGCSSMNYNTFTNCSCLRSHGTQTATGGVCVQGCSNLYPYMSLAFFAAFFSAMAIMPKFVVIVRCVKEENKPFALGMNAFIATLLGWLPGPVIFGVLVDSTCKLWKTTCTSVGACSLYDIELFRSRFHALSIGLQGITVVLYIIAFLFAVCTTKTVFQPHRDDLTVIVTTKDTINGAATEKTESGSSVENSADSKP